MDKVLSDIKELLKEIRDQITENNEELERLNVRLDSLCWNVSGIRNSLIKISLASEDRE
jgi:hypothetical protein